MRQVELVIVGGGPGGMAAAIEAVRCNVRPVLLDENLMLGGQGFRQTPGPFACPEDPPNNRNGVRAKKLIDEFAQYRDRIEVIQNASVWGIFGEELAIFKDGRQQALKADKLVLAEGAYDRSIPFPGWTLPGVMTIGGAQRLIKADKVMPGARILLAGSGPMLLVLAAEIIRAGGNVVAVLEAAQSIQWWRHVSSLWGQWELVGDALDYMMALRRSKVPYLTSHSIIEARGTASVKEIIYAKVDSDWRIQSGTEKSAQVDFVCAGFGLNPSTRLARLCGCDHKYDSLAGGWVPYRDQTMQTSVAGVYAVGDSAGTRGALVAMEEGRLAAIWVCQTLGRVTSDEAQQRSSAIVQRLKGLTRFESALNRVYGIRPEMFTRIKDGTIVCRCEEITAGQVRRAVADGALRITEVKKKTRVGMGYCQGRQCEHIIAGIISSETKRPVHELGYLSPRPPVKLLPLATFAAESQS